MYKNVAPVLMLCTLAVLAGEPAVELKTDQEKVGYAIGLDFGRNLVQADVVPECDQAALIRGLQDAIGKKTAALTDDQIQEVMGNFQQKFMAKRAEKAKVECDTNKKAGETFLAENAKKDGVKSTKSGLQYKIITEGTGETPKATDTVIAHYKGTLIDGTEFDSSYKRNKPADFGLDQVIAGWTEGFQLMKVGSKFQLFIPSDLAYGPQRRSAEIGPNSTLIFDIEFIGIQKEQPQPAIPLPKVK